MGLEELSSAAHGNSGPASKALRACRCPQQSTVLVQHGIGDVGDFNVGQLSAGDREQPDMHVQWVQWAVVVVAGARPISRRKVLTSVRSTYQYNRQ